MDRASDPYKMGYQDSQGHLVTDAEQLARVMAQGPLLAGRGAVVFNGPHSAPANTSVMGAPPAPLTRDQLRLDEIRKRNESERTALLGGNLPLTPTTSVSSATATSFSLEFKPTPSTPSKGLAALNGLTSAVATAVLPGTLTPEEWNTWNKQNPNAGLFDGAPVLRYEADLGNASLKRVIETSPGIGEQLTDVLSLGFRPVGKGLGTFFGSVDVATDDSYSMSTRQQAAYDAGGSSLSVPAAWLMTGAPGLRFSPSSPRLMGPNDGPQLPAWGGAIDYTILVDSASVGPGKAFTSTQKANIYSLNLEANGGLLRSDLTGEVLVLPKKSQSGVTPPWWEAQVDHVISRVPADPAVSPGTNSYGNAGVLSRQQNRAKSNN